MKRIWWLVAMIGVTLSMPGCGGGGDGPGPGEVRMDSFSSDYMPIPTKIVRATVRNKDNQMMGGVLVSFSTSAGQLCEDVEVNAMTMACINTPNGPSIETNVNGIADIYLILGSFPSATVTAMASASHQRDDVNWHDNVGTGTISATIQVSIVENIRLLDIEVGPTADTRIIRVLVTGPGPRETPLENVAVRFHSSGGQFVDHQDNPASIPEVRTNRHGIGLIHLKSTHPVTVTARADNKSIQFPVQF